MIEYAYGDLTYYALRRQGAFESAAALLWPTRGTLCRKEIVGPINAGTVRRGIGAKFQQLHRIDAAWLRELGCEVRGLAFGSWWRVRSRQ